MEWGRPESFPWPACLAIRENRLPSGIPHVPLVIEDIPRYASSPDFRENCIKSVQTIGEIVPGTARVACLRSVTSDREARVTLSLEGLPVDAFYCKDGGGKRLFIWEKSRIFKVFGMLEQRKNEVVLIAHKLLRVQDVRGSLDTLSLLSRAVRPMYYQVESRVMNRIQYSGCMKHFEIRLVRNCNFLQMLRAGLITAIRPLPNRNMSIFTQCLNPLTGVASWEEKDQYYDYHQEVARSAFADMLHDHERNEKYYIALKAAIEKKHQAGEDANVLDIGTGTGLLSMMAARCGADTITACEAFKPMANCAAKIIKENGFEDRIKLIRKRSTKMIVGEGGDMPKRANILVTEVFDTELIGEGALSTFRHAYEILLEEDSIVVPHRGTVWAQVVESTKVCAWNRVKCIKNGEMLVEAPPTIQACSGAAAVHDMQLSRLPRDTFVPLLPAQSIFRFDWSGKKPLLNNEKVSLLTQPITSGTAHAIFMWWDLNMDTDNQILLSCAPVWEHPNVPDDMKKDASCLQRMADTIPWRDHWMQAVYYLPEEVPITYGVEVNLIGYHDEYSFWFKLLNGPTDEIPDCQRPECNCWAHIAYSRTRIGQLNDTVRNQRYLQALRRKITPNSVCLCVSDGCLLALAIARLGTKVFLLEQNFLSRKTMEMFVQANGLSDRIKIVESIDGLPEASEINFIFGEPYFLSSIVPWENLRFWYLASRYPSSIAKMPIAATIKAAAVEFKDLQKIRAPLGTCEGFDLSSFDRLIQASSEKSDNPVEAQPLWEYPCKALSLSFDIIKLDLTRNVNFDERKRITGEIPILDSGSCNGVAIWVDWQLNSDLSISCGPIEEIVPGKRVSWDPYTRQGVHLFRRVSNVTKKSTLSWSFTFVPQNGEVEFEFNVLTND